MKRRSPWLAFAACAFLKGALFAEDAPAPVAPPRLSLSKAAVAAEVELEKRGLAGGHVVSGIALATGRDGPYYLAQIDPPILDPAPEKETKETTPAEKEPTRVAVIKLVTRLAFQVGMDGRVTAKQVDPNRDRQRVRVIKSN